MKRCPECRRDYYDDSLLYCLDDGNALLDGPAIHDLETEVFGNDAGGAARDREPATQILRSRPSFSTEAAERTEKTSIAVLPFVNMSADAENEYFCDGLADELINALAKIENLKVVARTSAFSFKGSTKSVTSIGSVLNVDTVLEGSVRKAGDRLRINVQLINVADGFHIWTERYDRQMVDIFDLEDEVAAAVVGSLRSKLAIDPTEARYKRYTENVRAYELYLQGRFFLNKFTAEYFEKAADFFEQSLLVDPNYALAYAGLADAYVMLSELGPLHAADAMPKARENALKALALDSELSEAHCSLGLIYRDFGYDFGRAEASFKQAIKLQPSSPTPHLSYGLLLAYLGRHAEGEAQFRAALDVDPLSEMGNWIYSLALFLDRSYDACLAQSKRTLELDPGFPGAFLTIAFANQMKGNFAEAVEAYAKFSGLAGNPQISAFGQHTFSVGGWYGFLHAMTGDERPAELSSYVVAAFHAGLDEKDKAIAELEKAVEARESYVAMLNVDPRFDPIRDEPGFHHLIERIGFPH
jgi:TolB-like protein/Tfp pilus assembly protein PilF